MKSTNYTVIATNAMVATTPGVIPRTGPHENNISVGHKSRTFFEFWCWSDDEDNPENMSAASIVVFEN
jgi:hypothetical protein